MWEVVLVAEVEEWFLAICNDDPATAEQITAAIDLLAETGPTLGRPAVDRIKGSALHNLKELRPGSAGTTEVRILFAFDPQRQAVLLTAGDKAGAWKEWYAVKHPARRAAIPGVARTDEVTKRRKTPGEATKMAKNWREVRAAAAAAGGLDEQQISNAKKDLRESVRAFRLADVRKAQTVSQTELAGRMDVSQVRVSKIERGELGTTQLGTLESYIEALGGHLRVVADFGDQELTLR
jgi:hypothetical protein